MQQLVELQSEGKSTAENLSLRSKRKAGEADLEEASAKEEGPPTDIEDI